MHGRRHEILEGELARLRQWLACFEGTQARAGLMPSGQTLYVRSFPMPTGFNPDHLDLALVIPVEFPVEPPVGFYALLTEESRPLIEQLRRRFNVFAGGAAHGAPPIQGFQWLCAGYLSGWRFNVSNPAQGDNLLKHFLHLHRLLENAA